MIAKNLYQTCVYIQQKIFLLLTLFLKHSFQVLLLFADGGVKIIKLFPISLFKVKLYLLIETSKQQTSSSADFVSDVVRNEQLWTLTFLSLDH